MRKFGVFLFVSVMIVLCSCHLFKRKSQPSQPEQPKVPVNSIALNISIEGEDTALLGVPFDNMLAEALKARGYVIVKGATQPTDMALEGKFSLVVAERSQAYGPDKFRYRISGGLKMTKRATGEVLIYKDINLDAVQLGKELAVQTVVKMAVETIVQEVLTRTIRTPGS
jgi:hypothetical protein